MATQVQSDRFALRWPQVVAGVPAGVWWPESRRLSDELAVLFELWPPEAGRISRVLYSPPDWDDHPRAVAVRERRVKTGCFLRDDTRELVLTMGDRRRVVVAVIPPDTLPTVASGLLADYSVPRPTTDAEPVPGWENEGGHL